MAQNKELEIRAQFLDEAQEYLDALDDAVIGLADQQLDAQKINAALRAAHSVKGGAAMMGFMTLSELAHRLEDFFKVLKIDRNLDLTSQLENLLLSAIACLRQVVDYDRVSLQTGVPATSPDQVALDIQPLFEQLHTLLGDPQEETAGSMLSSEEGQDIVPLLFETEVESSLQCLETLLATPNSPALKEEVQTLAQELGGLGEMLQLPAFSQLCESVMRALDIGVVSEVAQEALQSWRRAQAVVIVGQYDMIPSHLPNYPPAPSDLFLDQDLDRDISFDDFASLTDSVFPGVTETLPTLPTEPELLIPEPVTQTEDWYAAALAVDETLAVDDQGFTDLGLDVGFTDVPAEPAPTTSPQPAPAASFKRKPQPAETVEDDPDATVRVPVRQLNSLNDLFGELTIDRNGLDLYLKRMRNLSQILHERIQTLDLVNAKLRSAYDRVTLSEQRTPVAPAAAPAANASLALSPAKPGFDVLEMDRYNDLHLLSQQVMEMIVQLQEVTEDIEITLDDTEQSNRNLIKTSRQLQTGLSQLRMRPLADVVDRFPRAVREWSLQYNKRVRLNIVGGNTLVDRNILESLSDPLMHLLRNAFDHGIEDVATRQSRGKAAEGLIEIRANHQGNRTIITIQDDGKGIAIDKIRQRAEQMGLDPVLLNAAEEQELLSLIFEPGFSTRDEVTSLSGRGVGMDVVRSNLKQIRGEITVQTEPGQGTTFTLSVPFTLSTVRILLVESCGMLLAFPTETVMEMLLLQNTQVIPTAGGEVVNWQNQMVQLVRLQKWFQFNCPRTPHGFETPPTIAFGSIVIVQPGDQMYGIQIDRCWGEQEATIRRVEGSLAMPPGFSGCTILGDGRVIPLVSVSELLRWVTSCERSGGDPVTSFRMNAQQRLSLAGTTLPTVLVVDDSINVRRFLALTLERAGYRVEQAKDGQDALERLEAGLTVQVVVCDIEMPRLDGFGFLAKAKGNPELAQTPIVMLTSRSGDKHRKLAESLGASAYFAKPYNEQVLLRTIEQMVKTITVA
jgi:chemosensory pili system protein ChpA (sensor histidine kinase/response regulator)